MVNRKNTRPDSRHRHTEDTEYEAYARRYECIISICSEEF